MSESGNEERFYEESLEEFDLCNELTELVLNDNPILSVIYPEKKDEH